MLDMVEFQNRVHKTAQEHGWHDKDRSKGEVFALIHSELSEALEEYRCRRPMVWYKCLEGVEYEICDPNELHSGYNCGEKICMYRKPKPEGIVVELCDAIIRIMDLFGEYGHEPSCRTLEELVVKYAPVTRRKELPDAICDWHLMLSKAYHYIQPESTFMALERLVANITQWIDYRQNGVRDTEDILLVKAAYNETRPYRHGNKRC